MTTEETLAQRVAKLMNMTEEAGATRAEAEQAAALAERLILKYNLDMAAVREARKEKSSYIRWDKELDCGDGPYKAAHAQLLHVITKNLFCRMIRLHNGKVAVLGEKDNLEAAMEMYHRLAPAIMVMAERARPERFHIITWKRDFLFGACAAIDARMQEARKEQEQADNQTTALIVLKDKELMQAQQQFFPEGTRRLTSQVRTAAAYNAGYRAGQDVSLFKRKELH